SVLKLPARDYPKIIPIDLFCITYLAKTTSLADMAGDPWFTRGWTLQELLAPVHLKFYNTYWKVFNKDRYTDKSNPEILAQIYLATNITKDELDRVIETLSIPISRKMQWAAMREVTREEDSGRRLLSHGNLQHQHVDRIWRGIRERVHAHCKGDSEHGPLRFGHLQSGGRHVRLQRIVSSPSRRIVLSAEIFDIQLDALTPIKPITLTHLGLRVALS
ncbi:hypothetical protein BJ912DRAFT_1126722, partial [Pholiota molesta]